MARAARGAGAVTEPNSILAGGPFLVAGFAAVFFVAPAAGAFVAALTGGLICSAETAPQISNSARQSASLCIDLAPFPSRAPKPITNNGGNWSAKAPRRLNRGIPSPNEVCGRIQEMFRRTG